MQVVVVVVGCPARKDLAVSTRKATEEAAQVGAGPEWEGRRKEESEESVKPGQVVPTGLAQIDELDNYYPNYPIHLLYFGEVETPYCMHI